MVLVNEHGDLVQLGSQITTPGGEGAIYEIANGPSSLAKIYHNQQAAIKVAKLQQLSKATSKSLLDICALPTSLIYSRDNKRLIRGFIMSRISGKEIHRLYGPRDRQAEFPHAAWDFLIHVARNCAAAFETLHEHGVVMADVNEKNFLVTVKGLVRLIDCDSYQIRNGNGYYSCDVGVPLWTAPELQGRSFKGLIRKPNHDRFGLAVLIFQLLFMGRHPFAGVPVGNQFFEIHEAIQKYLFAFTNKTQRLGVRAPPHTLPLNALPEKIADLFERAFLPGSENPNARPSGREWAHELDHLYSARKTCNYDRGHVYWNGLSSCPWCEISNNNGPNFFIAVAIHLGVSVSHADVSAFWAAILRISAGDLMKMKVDHIQLPSVTAKPLPFLRPSPPNIIKPQPPDSPNLTPPPVVQPPILPPPPEPVRIEPVFNESFPPNEKLIFKSLICSSLAAFGCFAALSFQIVSVGVCLGLISILFLLIWAAKYDKAMAERQQRLSLLEEARNVAKEKADHEHAIQLLEYNSKLKEIGVAHEKAVLKAKTDYERQQSGAREAYNSRLKTFQIALRYYEEEQNKHLEALRVWNLELQRRSQLVDQSRRELDETVENFKCMLEAYQRKIGDSVSLLRGAYDRYNKTNAQEIADLKLLESKKRVTQLNQFLDSKLIRNHKIPGIGPLKAATLLGYGIESALDITPTLNVSGIGQVLLGNLLAWRQKCESEFCFNPSTPLAQNEVQAVKLKHAQIRQSALVELRSGASNLSKYECDARKSVYYYQSKIATVARAYAQALADKQEFS